MQSVSERESVIKRDQHRAKWANERKKIAKHTLSLWTKHFIFQQIRFFFAERTIPRHESGERDVEMKRNSAVRSLCNSERWKRKQTGKMALEPSEIGVWYSFRTDSHSLQHMHTPRSHWASVCSQHGRFCVCMCFHVSACFRFIFGIHSHRDTRECRSSDDDDDGDDNRWTVAHSSCVCEWWRTSEWEWKRAREQERAFACIGICNFSNVCCSLLYRRRIILL